MINILLNLMNNFSIVLPFTTAGKARIINLARDHRGILATNIITKGSEVGQKSDSTTQKIFHLRNRRNTEKYGMYYPIFV